MKHVDDPYIDLRPISGEELDVDYDEEFEMWGLFGEESGFCYRQSFSKEELEECLVAGGRSGW